MTMAIGRAGGAGNSGAAEAARRAAAEAARRAAEEAARRAAAEAARRAAAEAAARQATEVAARQATQAPRQPVEAAARQPTEVATRQQQSTFEPAGAKDRVSLDAVAARPPADAARRPTEAAMRQQQSTFEPAGAKNRLNLDGASAPATSLLNENTNDTAVNCLDQAADWVNRSSPELQARSELVFLEDQRAGAEGQSGHVVVRQGERVLDPSNGQSYEDMQAFSQQNPQYREAGTLSGTDAARVFATQLGSPERAQALAEANVSPELQRMMVADPPIEGDVPNPATAEPRDITVPGQAGPVSVEFSDSLEQEVQRENGNVTVTIEAETSVSATGEVEIGTARVGASGSAGVSTGNRSSYEVTMREEDFARLQRGEIPPPHPLNPQTIPDGTSITMEQSQFTGTSQGVGFNYHAAELGLEGSVTEGSGMSVEVSRTGDTVQVTAGPSEFIENDGTVSLGAGPVSVSGGRTDTLSEYSLRTAEFDLSNPQGQQAFNAFATTGRMPEQDGPGVSNARRIDRVSYESVGAQFNLDIGELNLGTEGTTNTGEFLVTHNPDGTRAVTQTLTYGGDHPDMRVERTFGADGQLIPGSETFALTFDTTDDLARQSLVESFTGDPAQGQAAAAHDEPITLNLTAADVQELQQRSSENPMGHLGLGGLLRDYDGEPLEPTLAVRNMAASPAYNEFGLAQAYWGLYLDSGRTDPLPGTLTLG
jgi:hypothetical protein